MELTPEEKMIRDYYLGSRRSGITSSFELMALLIGVSAFLYGFWASDDSRAMMFTGFTLVAAAALRYLYAGFTYEKHIASLLRKYEDQLRK